MEWNSAHISRTLDFPDDWLPTYHAHSTHVLRWTRMSIKYTPQQAEACPALHLLKRNYDLFPEIPEKSNCALRLLNVSCRFPYSFAHLPNSPRRVNMNRPTSFWKGEGRCGWILASEASLVEPTSLNRVEGIVSGWFRVIGDEWRWWGVVVEEWERTT